MSNNPRTRVPAVGARRRIHALQRMGWPLEHLTALTGVATDDIAYSTRRHILRWVDDAIREVYATHADRPGPCNRTRGRATARGYAPPAAWDDDTIDDPDAVPVGVRVYDEPIHVEDVLDLARWGLTRPEIAHRLGVTRGAVDKLLDRAQGRPETAAVARLTAARVAANAANALSTTHQRLAYAS